MVAPKLRLLLALWLLAPLMGGATPALTVISGVQVTQALQAAGVQAEPGDVKFLSVVEAKETDFRLNVVEFERLTPRTTRVRLQCETTAQCLPFYVVVHSEGQLPGPERRPRAARAAEEPWLVRTGMTVKLILEGKTLRMTMPVICLQNGRRGETIRVTGSDRKEIFLAEVIESQLVRVKL
jgi:hypothetical protein